VELAVYVDRDCPGCARAREIAADIRARARSVVVRIVELADTPDLPESVVAVPAYVLDGRLISLGNPRKSEILAVLSDGSDANEALQC
jgi:hypothetical protein